MSKILEQALTRVKELPDDRQDQIGRWLLDVVDQDTSNVGLSKGQEQEVYRRVVERPEQPVSEAEAEEFLKKLV